MHRFGDYEAKNVEEMQKSVENLDVYKNLFVGDKVLETMHKLLMIQS